MAANPRVVSAAGSYSAVTPPASATGAPAAVQAAALVDGAGNIVRALDNGDGTATLSNALATVTSASATGSAAASVAATLTGAAGKTTYITGFSVTATNPAAAVNGIVTVAGVLGGTLSYQFVEPSTTGAQLIVNFTTPLPSSALNTNIVVTLPAITSGGAGAVTAHGFLV